MAHVSLARVLFLESKPSIILAVWNTDLGTDLWSPHQSHMLTLCSSDPLAFQNGCTGEHTWYLWTIQSCRMTIMASTCMSLIIKPKGPLCYTSVRTFNVLFFFFPPEKSVFWRYRIFLEWLDFTLMLRASPCSGYCQNLWEILYIFTPLPNAQQTDATGVRLSLILQQQCYTDVICSYPYPGIKGALVPGWISSNASLRLYSACMKVMSSGAHSCLIFFLKKSSLELRRLQIKACSCCISFTAVTGQFRNGLHLCLLKILLHWMAGLQSATCSQYPVTELRI